MKKEIVDKMSLQEVIDFIGSKLAEQGERCIKKRKCGFCKTDKCSHTNTISCLYGNDKGQHCAIGWVLDESNEKLMSITGGVATLIDNVEESVPVVIKNNNRLFIDLQNLHDANNYQLALYRLNDIKKHYDYTFNAHWDTFIKKAHGQIL